MKRHLAGIFALALTARAADFSADSARGAQLFDTLACSQCHGINGQGRTVGPDLGRMVDRNFTPATLAATLWNHAPKMWATMRSRQIEAGELSEQGAADLLAFFYANRFFEKPGDAARGIRLFSMKHCAECHGLSARKIPEARPVAEWDAMRDPIALVDAMWNHSATMREEFAKRKLKWPELQPQDLADMLVYLRNIPRAGIRPPEMRINANAKGGELFESKGCVGCHIRSLDLSQRLRHMTLTDIAVALWNHHPKMNPTQQRLDVDQMRELISYVWARQFFEGSGNPAAGQRVFTLKRCAGCHENGTGGATKLPKTGQEFTGASMVSALWRHGPRMMDQMQASHVLWPRFDAPQMSNLIAFLNSAKGGTQ